jgi:hypothetical protein
MFAKHLLCGIQVYQRKADDFTFGKRQELSDQIATGGSVNSRWVRAPDLDLLPTA